MTNRFDTAAKDWDKKKMRIELASAIAGSIKKLPLTKEMRCMDFGCGTGLVGLALAGEVAQLVGFDSSAGMLEVFQQKAKNMKCANVIPQQGELLATGFDEPFDLVISSMTLHHIEDVSSILEKLHSILKSGGLIAIGDLDKEDGSFHQEGSGEKHHGFDRDELSQLLKNSGFSNIKFETVHTITKLSKEGALQDYAVFLAVGEKA